MELREPRSLPYKCRYCSYTALAPSRMVQHERTHTGEKPYACTECPYRTTATGPLRVHMRKHTGEKPYACRQCDYRSTNASALSVHARSHSGEKPYACRYCDYRTTTSGSLRSHERGLHPAVMLAHESFDASQLGGDAVPVLVAVTAGDDGAADLGLHGAVGDADDHSSAST